ncbi:ABC transporter ATP-binding protein [Lederbergia galactosidilytica]|uniref:Bacitracin ABC transporter ATP-binding protein n=1 Tax=Lederbergia galactosidilytica TaxID=217031 RepID=A0A177ZIR2_9BACI|nr:ATP-binding cassette domain-containing protein [Lederbergia galactosidilytica]OAK67503.1 bacitracin ABC transporter ATP-binding protein [Lederbergia galactosidilytica]
MNELVLKTSNLTKRFKGKQAVNGVDLAIQKGEIYGFLGPNGAGKTTTIRMLLGLMKPTHGSIHIFGQDLSKHKLSILSKVGSLVESPSYYGHLTAIENLEALRKILNVPKARIGEVLEIVRLTNEAKRPVKGFSLGMKQRLGIAAALLGNPELLILDEPTNGLDPAGIQEMRELIKSLPKKFGVTVVVSSHLLSEIDQMATRVGIITKGSLIFQDSIEVLRKRSSPTIRIHTNNQKEARKILLSSGIQVQDQDPFLTLDQADNMLTAKAVANLVKGNLSVYRVEEQKMSLEEIFLDLTKEEMSL